MPHIDREKVLAVLQKRFPQAPPNDVAAAANAIVGLEPEYTPVPPAEVARFECDAAGHHYGARHVANGDVCVYRRTRTLT